MKERTAVKRLALAGAVVVAAVAPAWGADLIVRVEGVRSTRGDVQFGLYDNPESFPKKGMTIAGGVVPASSDPVMWIFRDIPPGTYAVAVFHDRNSNDKFDLNLIFNREGFGFSRDAKVGFGPPDYAAAKIEVVEPETTITITMQR